MNSTPVTQPSSVYTVSQANAGLDFTTAPSLPVAVAISGGGTLSFVDSQGGTTVAATLAADRPYPWTIREVTACTGSGQVQFFFDLTALERAEAWTPADIVALQADVSTLQTDVAELQTDTAIPGQPTAAQAAFAATGQTLYINTSTGDDSNPGTALAPWLTYGRYRQAIGPALIEGAAHIIYLTGSLAATDPVLPPNVGATGSFTMATPGASVTVVHSGTISAVQNADPATNADQTVEDGSLDWTPYVNMRLYNVTRSRTSWIVADKGSGVARTSIPGINNQVGDAYQVQTVSTVAEICFDNTVVVPGGVIEFVNLDFTAGALIPHLGIVNSVGNTAINFDSCLLGGTDADAAPAMTGSFNATYCLTIDPVYDDGSIPVLTNSAIVGGGVGAAVFNNAYPALFACTAQGILFAVNGKIYCDSLGMWDPPGNAIAIDAGGFIQVTTDLYGDAGSNTAVVMYAGANSLTWQGDAPTITGAVVVDVAGVHKTWADGWYSNHGAGFGPAYG